MEEMLRWTGIVGSPTVTPAGGREQATEADGRRSKPESPHAEGSHPKEAVKPTHRRALADRLFSD